MQINQQCIVTFHYALLGEKGEVMDTSRGQEAVSFTVGEKQILPGLEEAMLGKSTGDKFQLKLKAAQGYGEWSDDKVYDIAASAFSELESVEIDMICEVTNPEGNKEIVSVVSVEEDLVTVDANHPYAGVDLKFSVEIMDVSKAL
jgi:FKBP-type peptidyl-prolyl cis-trans isomerase SlyD